LRSAQIKKYGSSEEVVEINQSAPEPIVVVVAAVTGTSSGIGHKTSLALARRISDIRYNAQI